MLPGLLFMTLWLATACAFYVPGWSIKSYRDEEQVPLYVNKVSSDETQLPYAYAELPFICPIQSKHSKGLNLGEVLRGDRIEESNYDLKMGKGTQCQELCKVTVDKETLEKATELITNNYLVEWIVDNLPGATAFISVDRTKRYYAAGFPLGSVDKNSGAVMLNNHVTLLIRHRPDKRNPGRSVIVGFEVYPKSISLDSEPCAKTEDIKSPLVISSDNESQDILYTYSVYWREDTTVEWANRWDSYFSYSEGANGVHWLSVANSLIIALLGSIATGVVLIRTLSRDIKDIQQNESLGEDHKDPDDISGWKLVRADVFRLPKHWLLLLSLVGSGAQFIAMTSAVVLFACIGILNPSYRGGLISFAVFLFAISGIFGGYWATRTKCDNDGSVSWASAGFGTAVTIPSLIMVVVLVLNMVLWANSSSSALPFGTIVALFLIWLLICSPLTLIGGFIGSKFKPKHAPGRTSSIPRQIPVQPWFKKAIFSVLAFGLPPFLVIYVELVFVFQSLWQEKMSYYYMYGFFAVTCTVLVILVMEMAIISAYTQLNAENYHWWWRSFFVAAGSSWWIFGYSLYYYFWQLSIDDFSSSLIFFGYSVLGCMVYGLFTGTIGFTASYVFVRRIYGAIKTE